MEPARTGVVTPKRTSNYPHPSRGDTATCSYCPPPTNQLRGRLLDCGHFASIRRWVHQAQIREATGRPPWGRDDVRAQLIDTLIRAIPHTLNRHALSGESLRVDVVDLGRSWSWQREADGWSYAPYQQSADAVVRIDSDTLWHVAARMIQPVDAVKHAHIEGDTPLARAALHLLSIIR